MGVKEYVRTLVR